jgi:hypothetical protein
MNNSTTPIQSGDTLTGQFITDSDTKIIATVVSRKGNFAIINLNGEISRKKVYSHNGQEWIMPYGTYSMAPSISKR